MSKCLTKFCRGVTTERGHSPYCSKCRSRRWKDKYPLHYSFKQLRNDAKRRQKEFDLSREQYIAFAEKTGYDKGKGRGAGFLSIDRIDAAKGYLASNIRALTVRANSARAHYVGRMPQWLKDEIAAAERGVVPESHRNIGTSEHRNIGTSEHRNIGTSEHRNNPARTPINEIQA